MSVKHRSRSSHVAGVYLPWSPCSKYLISGSPPPKSPSHSFPYYPVRELGRSGCILQITCDTESSCVCVAIGQPSAPTTLPSLIPYHPHRAHHDFQAPANPSTPLRSNHHVGWFVLIRSISHEPTMTQFALQNSGRTSPLPHQTGVSCPSDSFHNLIHHRGA